MTKQTIQDKSTITKHLKECKPPLSLKHFCMIRQLSYLHQTEKSCFLSQFYFVKYVMNIHRGMCQDQDSKFQDQEKSVKVRDKTASQNSCH